MRLNGKKTIKKKKKHSLEVLGAVFPFKVNQYILDELIDWGNIPDDPIFQTHFSS
ncbi:hypothetical protein ACFS3C_21345 [Azotobacter vinelandii]